MTNSSRRVLLAAPRGYCAGVDRAVVAVEKALDLHGSPIYVRKQIVHNKHVVETLEARGAIFVDETDEVPEGSIVVFSAHGVAPAVHDEARERNLRTIDATCPLVTKVHHEARRFAAEGYDILLIGHEGHEEVVGTTGEALDIQLVDGPHDVDSVQVRDPAKIAWLSQTTLSVDETVATVDRLRERFPLLVDPPSDDICYATQNRQVAVKKIAAGSDLMLVVGVAQLLQFRTARRGRTRSRLAGGVPRGPGSGHRRGMARRRRNRRSDKRRLGPRDPRARRHRVLAERGWTDVEEVTSAQESLLFALPPELRRDLKPPGPADRSKRERDAAVPARTLVAPTHRCERNGEQGAREQQRR